MARIWSIRQKLMLVVLATTFCALSVTAIAMVIYESRAYRDAVITDLRTQAAILGGVSVPALMLNEPDSARASLALVKLRPSIVGATITDARGKPFASFPGDENAPPVLPAAPPQGYRIQDGLVIVSQPIVEGGETLGTVSLRARYELQTRLNDYLVILAAALIASLVVAVLMSALLQQMITQPILDITGVARDVMDKRDYSQRVLRSTNDEVGFLVDAFNAMLSEAGRHSDAIEATNRALIEEATIRRTAEEALRASNRRKDEFLAILAHELRNPLGPLRNALEILRLSSNNPAQAQKSREMMERQLRQMVRLVDDLLDVSRITTGKLVLKKDRIDLRDVVQDAIEATKPAIDARRHTLQVAIPDARVDVDADATRLMQVFANLLSNAAKYTEPGGQIRLVVERRADTVEIRVSDSGIGIEASMQSPIFDMFMQADHSVERATTGLGVGLTLARQFVELHGGTIRVRSEGLQRGSEFTVRLPLDTRDAAPAPDSVSARDSAPAGRDTPAAGHRILVVDDNVDFAASLAILLHGMGNEVWVANDGVEAVNVASIAHPDIAFLDLGLPGMNGYDLARRLRAMPELGRLALVAVTGLGQEKDRQRGREAGFDHYLIKPVEPAAIEAIVRAQGGRADATVKR